MQFNSHAATLHFEQAGSGPAILFIHDGVDNRLAAAPEIAALAGAGYRVVVTNLRGFGAPTDLTALTGDAVALLNSLGIGRAVVFGIGRGGYVLLDLLERHPERVAVSSFVATPQTASALRTLAEDGEVRGALSCADVDTLKRTLLATPSPPPERLALSKLPALRSWIEKTAAGNGRKGKECSKVLADMQLPPLLIESEEPVSAGSRRRFGRLRAFSSKVRALFDLFTPRGEVEDYEEEDLAESL